MFSAPLPAPAAVGAPPPVATGLACRSTHGREGSWQRRESRGQLCRPSSFEFHELLRQSVRVVDKGLQLSLVAFVRSHLARLEGFDRPWAKLLKSRQHVIGTALVIEQRERDERIDFCVSREQSL